MRRTQALRTSHEGEAAILARIQELRSAGVNDEQSAKELNAQGITDSLGRQVVSGDRAPHHLRPQACNTLPHYRCIATTNPSQA